MLTTHDPMLYRRDYVTKTDELSGLGTIILKTVMSKHLFFHLY